MRRSLRSVMAWVCVPVLLGACGGSDGGGEVDESDIPAAYAGKTNPFPPGNTAAISAGMTLYGQQCAECHGDDGSGNGPESPGLDPPPGNLIESAGKADDYLFWRISDGGENVSGRQTPVISDMPSWRGLLSEDQRWQLISYIRTL